MLVIRSRRRFRILPMVKVILYSIIIISLYFPIHELAIEISHFYFYPCSHSYYISGNRIVFNSPSYSIHHYPEFICPQNFRNLADWVYGWPKNVFNEHLENYFSTYKFVVSNLSDGSIIYVKTDYVSPFFSDIYPLLQYKIVLITGDGDIDVPSQYLHYLEKSDSKIIHWFGQNGNINATRSKRFTHIPIGINCYEMAEGLRGLHREYPNSTLSSISNQSLDESSRYIQPLDITQRVLHKKHHFDKLVLLNFDLYTDRSGARIKLWKNNCRNNSKQYVACLRKQSGIHISGLSNIYRRNRQYPLWLSPRGGGLDCHRTWEALYLDVVPIVWHSTLDSLYENLPIIIIKNWDEIDEQFLRDKLHNISMKKMQQPSVYQYEKLRNGYWRDLIISKSRYAYNKTMAQKNRCWRARTIR